MYVGGINKNKNCLYKTLLRNSVKNVKTRSMDKILIVWTPLTMISLFNMVDTLHRDVNAQVFLLSLSKQKRKVDIPNDLIPLSLSYIWPVALSPPSSAPPACNNQSWARDIFSAASTTNR